MEAVSIKGEWMQEQMMLFKVEESYNLADLKKICREEVKKNFPAPVQDEDYLDYLDFLESETNLLFAERLRKIADEIENAELGEQKRVIQEVYGKKVQK